MIFIQYGMEAGFLLEFQELQLVSVKNRNYLTLSVGRLQLGDQALNCLG